jgi:hypothetical protein
MKCSDFGGWSNQFWGSPCRSRSLDAAFPLPRRQLICAAGIPTATLYRLTEPAVAPNDFQPRYNIAPTGQPNKVALDIHTSASLMLLPALAARNEPN